MEETPTAAPAGQKKRCEQCQAEKDVAQFRKVTNQYTGVHPMSICRECYDKNSEERKQREAAEMEARTARRTQAGAAARPVPRLWRPAPINNPEESARVWTMIPTLMLAQLPGGTKDCEDCGLPFPVDKRGCLIVPFLPPLTCPRCEKPLHIEYHEEEGEEGWISYGCQGHLGGGGRLYRGFSPRYCPACHEVRRRNNRQSYPLCPLCGTPTRVYDFLREYRGYRLDLIKVCCKQCIPRFLALCEPEQLTVLRAAMVKAYGGEATIYALQYDERFPCQHIGRTKHYARRMAEYKRDWYRPIQRHFVLQQLPFGPLSMEYESRWILHALKYGWPIDNFELQKLGEDGLGGQREQAELTEAVKAFEPLTAPFAVVRPLVIHHFGNTSDAEIVNWFCQQYHAQVYPGEQEMAERRLLVERLHRLRV